MTDRQELICIVCPRGCRLTVSQGDELEVAGAGCKRGVRYALEEVTDPKRVITTTVYLDSDYHHRCPVKSSAPISKALIKPVLEAINQVVLQVPVSHGQVVIENVLGTGVDILATRSFDQ